MTDHPSLFDDLETGRALRDAGAAQVEANTPDDWNAAADHAIGWLARSGREFTVDDVRARVGPPPGHPNAMGARFLAARRAGLIAEVGYARSGRADAHARRVMVYRGVQA